MKVLILGSGTQALAVAKDLHQAGHKVYLFTLHRHSYADDSKFVDKVIYSDSELGSIYYHHEVLSTLKKEQFDTIIPMGDITARYLSKNQDEIKTYVQYQMPNIEVFERAYDKNSLMKICAEHKYPHPFTINDIAEIDSLKDVDLPYPMLIKPNYTCGGRGMTLVHNYQELQQKYPKIVKEYGDCHLQQYIKKGGAQVEVQLYINEKHDLVESSVIYKYRWYPENGGSSCCATSVQNDNIVEILYHLLVEIGWIGFADFDTIQDPSTGELLIMELNPRVPACIRTAIEAGTKWGQIIVNSYLQKEIPQKHFIPGIILRHLGFEMLWFYHSKNKLKTKPCWFKFIGKNIYYQDFSRGDLKPFIAGTWNNVKKIHSPKFRKSKSGTR